MLVLRLKVLFLNVSGAEKFLGLFCVENKLEKGSKQGLVTLSEDHRIDVISLWLLEKRGWTHHSSLSPEKTKLLFAKTNETC